MLSKNKWLSVLSVLAALAVLGALALVIFYAPLELTMGLPQKIFYFHVSSAWLGMVSFFVAAIGGILYLARGKEVYDSLSLAGVELGLLFSVLGTVTGMLWARPVWNTYWTWDPRLTTMTIMGFTYLGYLLLRRAIDSPTRAARLGAIYAIVGFVSVPLTFFSARLLRTIHPTIFGNTGEKMVMTSPMYQTMAASIVAFTLLFVVLLWHRVRLEMAQRMLESEPEEGTAKHQVAKFDARGEEQ